MFANSLTIRPSLFAFALVLAGMGSSMTIPAWAQPGPITNQVHVLSLDNAITTALGRGEEITLAEGEVKSAEGNQKVARSGMLPQISASGNYTLTIKSQYSGL